MRLARIIGLKVGAVGLMCFLLGVIGGGMGSMKFFQENQNYLLPAFLVLAAVVVGFCVLVGYIIRRDVIDAKKETGQC